jgi:hypothetical protein
LLRKSILRIERCGGERVFVSIPVNRTKEPAAIVGIAY